MAKYTRKSANDSQQTKLGRSALTGRFVLKPATRLGAAMDARIYRVTKSVAWSGRTAERIKTKSTGKKV